MRTETAGWTGGEDKEIQSTRQLDFDLRNNKEDGQNEYYDKVY